MPGMYPSLMTDLIAVRCSPMDTVELAARHGFTGVDLRLNGDHLPTLNEAEQLKQRIAELGLRTGYCSVLPNKLSVSPEEWEANRPHLERRADIAAAIGFNRSATVVLPFHETLDFDAATEEHVERLRDVLLIFTQRGIRLGLEYVSPITRRAGKPFEFVHSLPGMLGLIEAAGNPTNLGIMLDTFHWHCAGETEEDLAALPAERIVMVHVCDAIAGRPAEEQVVNEREQPGASGVTDLAGFMCGLARAGYDGPVTAEPTNAKWATMDADEVCALTSLAVQQCMALAGKP